MNDSDQWELGLNSSRQCQDERPDQLPYSPCSTTWFPIPNGSVRIRPVWYGPVLLFSFAGHVGRNSMIWIVHIVELIGDTNNHAKNHLDRICINILLEHINLQQLDSYPLCLIPFYRKSLLWSGINTNPIPTIFSMGTRIAKFYNMNGLNRLIGPYMTCKSQKKIGPN